MTSDKAVGIYGVKLVAEVDTAATEIKAKLTVSCFIVRKETIISKSLTSDV